MENNINPSLINSSLPKASPLVSISCITYNHAKFIRQALDGFLMQEPPACVQSSVVSRQWSVVSRQEPWFEVLVHDDCSTDGTTEILKEYEAKYPDIMNVVYETENQYSKGGPWGSAVWNYPRARGKYIALCEGDDYWTDPLKLQKQVDFMEAHPEYSVCFCCYTNYNTKTGKYTESEATRLVRAEGDGVGMDLTDYHFLHHWVTMPMTILLRSDSLDFSLIYKYRYYRDVHETYLLMKNGKCYLFAFDGGVHNMHDGGVATGIDIEKRLKTAIEIAQEIYEHNHDALSKEYYELSLKWKLRYTKPFSAQRIACSTKIFSLNHNLWLYLKNIARKNE